MPHQEIVEDICCEECRGKTGYCTLKEIILHSGLSDRTLEQIKCIERFKWQESATAGRDIGWAESHKKWVERGYASKFAEIYRDGMSNNVLYEMVMAAVAVSPTHADPLPGTAPMLTADIAAAWPSARD